MAKIRVFKVIASGFPDYPMFCRDVSELSEGLESMLGSNGEYADLIDTAQITITFDFMEESELEALEEWCP